MEKRKPLRRRLCSVKECFNTSDTKKDISFFPFPRKNPLKEKWIKFCKDEQLLEVSDNVVKYRYICSVHFAPSCFSDKPHFGSHLIRGSVPTIYFTYTLDDIRDLKAMFQSKARTAPQIPPVSQVTSNSLVHKSISAVTKNVSESVAKDISSISKSTVRSDSKVVNNLLVSNATLNKPITVDVSPSKGSKHIILSPVPCNENISSRSNVMETSLHNEQKPVLSNPRSKDIMYCPVVNCPVNSAENGKTLFFPFPSRENDKDRFMKWCLFSRNSSIGKSDAKELYVCSLHFDEAAFEPASRTRLKADACPTLPHLRVSNSTVDTETNSRITSVESSGVKHDVESMTLADDLTSTVDTETNSRIACVESSSVKHDVELMTLADDLTNGDHHGTSVCQNIKDNISNNNVDTPRELLKMDDDNDTISSEQVSKDNGFNDEIVKCRKYKFVVTILKEIDERQDVKEILSLITKEVEKVLEDIISRVPAKETIAAVEERSCNPKESNKTVTDVNSNVMPEEGSGNTSLVKENGNCDKYKSIQSEDENCTSVDSNGLPLNIESQITDEFKTANKIYYLDNSNLCSDCGFLAKTVSRLNHHIKLYHEAQHCAICNEILPNLIEFRKHIKKHKRKKGLRKKLIVNKTRKYFCDICNVDCCNSMKLAGHKLIVHNVGEYHVCSVCNRMFATKYKMLDHKRIVHDASDDVSFICQYCGHTFKRHSNYYAHIKFMHLDQFKHFCSICSKRLRSPSALFLHMTKHVNSANKEEHDTATGFINSSFGKRFKCLVCNIRFTNGDVESLKRHMEFHANDTEIETLVGDDSRKLKCAFCNWHFPNYGKLAVHQYFHHNEVPYVCSHENCESKFWSSWDFSLHQKTVHAKRSFTCKTCNENFSSLESRSEHIKVVHADDKSVCCKICGKCFAMQCHLQMHMVVHDNKTYKCEFCDKVFKVASAFRLHLLSHQNSEDQESMKLVWRSKEQQENINKVFSDINEQMHEDMVAVENIELGAPVGEEIISIIDYSQSVL